MNDVRWNRFTDAAALAAVAAQRVQVAAHEAIAQRGVFRLVLAGGSTPLAIYRHLASGDMDIAHCRFYLGDEHCLEPDDAQRNSVMIGQAWPGLGKLPASQLHWIPAEQGAETAAGVYESVVAEGLPFDLVLLGMGEDGHTASLFPGHEHDPSRLVVPVDNAPKPPPARVSMNYATLGRTRELMVLVTGEAKRDALRAWQQGAALPVAGLRCEAGIDLFVDSAATA